MGYNHNNKIVINHNLNINLVFVLLPTKKNIYRLSSLIIIERVSAVSTVSLNNNLFIRDEFETDCLKI